MKIFICMFFSIVLVFSAETKTVKTSELELFLFKIGFQSLLKDVDLTKNKSNLNENELKKLNKKVEYIMNEIHKSNKIIKDDNSFSSSNMNNTVSNDEITLLKTQIKNLQKEVDKLKSSNNKEEEKDINKNIAMVSISFAKIKNKPITTAKTIQNIKYGEKLEIEFCDRFKWCKIKDRKAYIAKYTLKFL